MQAGKNIQLNIYTPESDGEKLSKHYSGKYLIERCEHIWDREQLRGYTSLIVGKKYVSLPSAYLLKADLM
jgi:hypothetical protein